MLGRAPIVAQVEAVTVFEQRESFRSSTVIFGVRFAIAEERLR